MNSQIIKWLLLSCLIFQFGCDISLKRKNNNHKMTPEKMSHDVKKTSKTPSPKSKMESISAKIITSFYSDETNSIIRKDMITHTRITNNQAKQLRVGKIIPRDIQVIPLPMILEKKLPSLSLNKIWVQIGRRIILMNVKSRRILEMIKI